MMPERRVAPGYPLAALLDGMAQVAAADDVQVTGLSHEAQTVRPGDLFVAVQGLRTHGLRYADQALARGAAAMVFEPTRDITPPAVTTRLPCIAVEHLHKHLGLVADRFFGHPSRDLTVIGVTGTDGKTSVSHFLAQALDESRVRSGLIGTLGYGLRGRLKPAAHTTPDAIRLHAELASQLAQGARAVLMEVSSHALAQHRVDGVAMDIAVFTNLTRDHLDYHQTQTAYAAAKRRLFELPGLSHAVINTDDAFGRELARSLASAAAVTGYGVGESPLPVSHRVRATGIESTQTGLRFDVHTPHGRGVIESGLLGRFNVHNLLAALAALLAFEMPLEQALACLRRTRGAPGRMERHGGAGNPIVVVDYAHTPAALSQVLIALREHCRGRLRCVFGCGGDRDRGKRLLMAQVAERHADEAIVTDDNPRAEPPTAITDDILKGFSHPAAVHVIHDRAEAIAHAISRARADDIVLVAGKGHERVQLLGTEQRPFIDSQQVEKCLRERGS